MIRPTGFSVLANFLLLTFDRHRMSSLCDAMCLSTVSWISMALSFNSPRPRMYNHWFSGSRDSQCRPIGGTYCGWPHRRASFPGKCRENIFAVRHAVVSMVTSLEMRPVCMMDWIGLCSVLRPRQHSICYMEDGFTGQKDPSKSIKVLKEKAVKENNTRKHEENRNYVYDAQQHSTNRIRFSLELETAIQLLCRIDYRNCLCIVLHSFVFDDLNSMQNCDIVTVTLDS